MRILNNTLKSPGKQPGSQTAWQTDIGLLPSCPLVPCSGPAPELYGRLVKTGTAGQRPQFVGCCLGTCISKKLPDDVYVLVRGACS